MLKIGTSSITVGSAAFKDDLCIAAAEMTVVRLRGTTPHLIDAPFPGGSGQVPAEGLSLPETGRISPNPPLEGLDQLRMPLIFLSASKSQLQSGRASTTHVICASAGPSGNAMSTPPSGLAPAVRSMSSEPAARAPNAAAARPTLRQRIDQTICREQAAAPTLMAAD